MKSGTSEHRTPFLMSSIADRPSHSDRTFFTATDAMSNVRYTIQWHDSVAEVTTTAWHRLSNQLH